MSAERVPDKLQQQRELYGEPVGELVRRVTGALGLSQGRLAGVLGLSAAMLSQLVTGQRVKIGNPAVVARLQQALQLAEEAPGLSPEEVQARLRAIGELRSTMANARAEGGGTDQVAVLRSSLRAVASGRELERAAAVLAEEAPGIAELLRVYGLGERVEAERHFQELRRLF